LRRNELRYRLAGFRTDGIRVSEAVVLCISTGVVSEIIEAHEKLQRITVRLDDGHSAPCLNYTDLVGVVKVGDRVQVNTTAVDLGLGTGGWHIVTAKLDAGGRQIVNPGPGHIIKLRYTPHQHSVLACEEEASPHHEILHGAQSLGGAPVVVGQLHSQLAPVVLGALDAAEASHSEQPRIAYVMTDSAALPLAMSDQVRILKSRGLICGTVTVGQAFGGDLEAVNLFSGLVAAKEVLKSDIIVVCQGPGNVGTDTALGFGGMDQAVGVNAVAALDGNPVAVVRVSFADPRPRHRGISHHTVTALCRGALARAVVPLPAELPEDENMRSALALISSKHKLERVQTVGLLERLRASGIPMFSMGRSLDDDPWFFTTAACAGIVAFRLLKRDESA
jgi:hypothetical protein